MIGVRKIGSVAHQAASQGIFPIWINRRDRIACSERHNLIAAAAEEGISIHDKRAGALVNPTGFCWHLSDSLAGGLGNLAGPADTQAAPVSSVGRSDTGAWLQVIDADL